MACPSQRLGATRRPLTVVSPIAGIGAVACAWPSQALPVLGIGVTPGATSPAVPSRAPCLVAPQHPGVPLMQVVCRAVLAVAPRGRVWLAAPQHLGDEGDEVLEVERFWQDARER